MRMGLGEMKPREKGGHATVEARNEDPSSSTRVEASSSQVPQDQDHIHGDDHDHGMDQEGAQGEETQEEAPQAQNDDDGELIQPQHQVSHPRVHQSIQRDHPIDNILGSIRKGVTTRSHLANFCGHYSFCFLFGTS